MHTSKLKYNRKSPRATWWDYSWSGIYFITICTKNREHYFGEIKNGKMHLSPVGVLADVFWHEIPHHFPNAKIDAFVVMPNHIHGILIITNNDPDQPNQPGTRLALSPELSPAQKRFRNQGKNTVSSIIGSYKSAVTKHANRLGLENGWQSRFHDRIIQSESAYQRVRRYIENNPIHWEKDKMLRNKR